MDNRIMKVTVEDRPKKLSCLEAETIFNYIDSKRLNNALKK